MLLESFHQARLKSQKAQDTSELSLNEDDKETRKKRKKVYYSSEEFSNDRGKDYTSDVLLVPPTLEEFEGKEKYTFIKMYTILCYLPHL